VRQRGAVRHGEQREVVAVNDNPNTVGGKSVTVEYAREDGSKTQVSYLHLKGGDTVEAGQ